MDNESHASKKFKLSNSQHICFVDVDITDPEPVKDSVVSERSSQAENWNCASCSFSNHFQLSVCEICEVSRTGKSFTSSLTQLSKVLCESSDSVYVEGIVELLMYYARFESFKLCHPPPCHFTQRNLYGKGWSCGYRNIQMLCSSLMQVPEFKSKLFNGDGIIPGIRDIQLWIEKAWRAGFDEEVNDLRLPFRNSCF
jgi:hypothetical protein